MEDPKPVVDKQVSQGLEIDEILQEHDDHNTDDAAQKAALPDPDDPVVVDLQPAARVLSSSVPVDEEDTNTADADNKEDEKNNEPTRKASTHEMSDVDEFPLDKLILGVKTNGLRTLDVTEADDVQLFSTKEDVADLGRLVEAELRRGPAYGSSYEIYKRYEPGGAMEYLNIRNKVVGSQRSLIGYEDDSNLNEEYANPITKCCQPYETQNRDTFELNIGVRRSGVRNDIENNVLCIPNLSLSLAFLEVGAVAFVNASALIAVCLEGWYIVAYQSNSNGALILFFTFAVLYMIVQSYTLAAHMIRFSLLLTYATWEPIWDFEYMHVKLLKCAPGCSVGAIVRCCIVATITTATLIGYAAQVGMTQMTPLRLYWTWFSVVSVLVGAILVSLFVIAMFLRWVNMMKIAVDHARDKGTTLTPWADQLSWKPLPPRCSCRYCSIRPPVFEMINFMLPIMTAIIFTAGINVGATGVLVILVIPIINYFLYKQPQWVKEKNIEALMEQRKRDRRIKNLYRRAGTEDVATMIKKASGQTWYNQMFVNYGLINKQKSTEVELVAQNSDQKDGEPVLTTAKPVTEKKISFGRTETEDRRISRQKDAKDLLENSIVGRTLGNPSGVEQYFWNYWDSREVNPDDPCCGKDSCDGCCTNGECELCLFELGREICGWVNTNMSCWGVLIAYSILFTVLSYIAFQSTLQPTAFPLKTFAKTPHYSVCESTYEASFNPTTALDIRDMVYLSDLVYYVGLKDYENIQTYVDAAFGPGRLEVLDVRPNHVPPSMTLASYDASRSFVIVVVRGTYSIGDMVEDVVLYGYAVYVQLLSNMIPLTEWWGQFVTRSVLVYCDSFRTALSKANIVSQFTTIKNYVNARVEDIARNTTGTYTNYFDAIDGSNRTLYIVGHSLGGGMSKLVGGYFRQYEQSEQTFSIGVSPPGTEYTSALVGVDANSISESAISIVVNKDYFPTVDNQIATSHVIGCPATQALTCHNPIQTLCTLQHACSRSNHVLSNNTYYLCLCDKDPFFCL